MISVMTNPVWREEGPGGSRSREIWACRGSATAKLARSMTSRREGGRCLPERYFIIRS
jgi:hypothetical protein